jgi:tetratricopeptide (TPR) repeat protein
MTLRLFSKSGFIFAVIVFLAFTLRLLYLNQTIDFIQPVESSDSYFYLQWAKDILRGNLLGKDVFYALPVFPYFLSLAYGFSGGEIFDLLLIQLFIGSINCGLIYILGKRLFNNQVGIIAAVIACGYRMFIFYDRMLLPASLTIFSGVLLALLLLKLRSNPSLRIWFCSGLFLGLCALICASFSLLAVVILFWIIYEYKKRPFKKRLLCYVAFIFPFFLIIGVISLRNYLVAGDPVLITAHSGINFYIGNNAQAQGLFKAPPYMRPTQSGLIEDAHIIAEQMEGRRLKPSEMSAFWFNRGLNFIKSRPLSYLKLLGRKFVLFWNGKEHIDEVEYYVFEENAGFSKFPFFRFSLICPLGLLGMFLSWPRRREVMPVYLLVFSLMLATIFFFINSRYRLVAVPYLIILAAFSVWQILEICRNGRYKKAVLIVVLFFALYLVTNIKVTSYASPGLAFHYNKGTYLSEQGRYREAEKEFQTALKLNAFDFMSYLGLGNIYYRMGDFPRAIEQYKKSLAINPYFCDAHFNLGMVYDEIGYSKQAEQEFKEVLKFLPEDYAAHYNLGRIYQKRGASKAALKAYEQALEINPGHQEILQAIESLRGR